MRQVYTTGQAAAVCHFDARTLVKAIEAGRLACYRIPGSTHRRIPRAALVAFMRAEGIPFDVDTGEHRGVNP